MEIPTRILNIADKNDENILRRKTAPYDFNKYSKKEIAELITVMRKVMDQAHGVGLAANQIGLDMSVFVVRFEGKFYAVFNPEITKSSDDKVGMEEGCLSVSDVTDVAYRYDKITLTGVDRNGKKLKIKAWGWLSTIFQHEVDHLNGKLFIDRLKK